jgi:hypothetical protein
MMMIMMMNRPWPWPDLVDGVWCGVVWCGVVMVWWCGGGW